MLRVTPFLVALALPVLACACSADRASTVAPAPSSPTAKEATPEPPSLRAQEEPAAAPTPSPTTPTVREKPSEEACRLACKKILGLAVEQVPEIRRSGAQSFMDAVVDEACPDKCMRSGTRASVACVNAAKTYEDAKRCPGTP